MNCARFGWTKISFCVLVGAGLILLPDTAWGLAATLPFFDDFAYPVLGPWWAASGTAPAPTPLSGNWWYRILDTCGPPSGTYHLVLDSCVAGTNNRNEVTLTVDLAGRSSVYLTFLAKSFSDLSDPLTPWAEYTGSKNFDGVVISPDGTTWYPLLSLTENDGLTRSYTRFTVSLDSALETWNIRYTPTFRIRFNHYGNGQVVNNSGSSGLGIDAVSVFESPPLACDFGDAPAPYPTLLEDNGARHAAVGPMLGATRDMTPDGLPTADASGDGTDEDGVVFVDRLVPGRSATLRVTASAPAKLDGWIDFNLNGSWEDAGEQVFAAASLVAGANDLIVDIPADAEVSDRVFARFRLSTSGGLSYTGAAADGEVEDYLVSVVPDAPVMDPEPSLAPGSSNTVSWAPVPQADSYYVECSQTADFAAIFQAVGWAPSTSQNFVGLWDVAQYYRVRAARLVPGAEASWNQTEDSEFSLDTLSETALYGGGKVTLRGPVIHKDTVGGAREDLKWADTNMGRFNVFKVSQAVRLTGFSMFLSRENALPVEFAVYEGGTDLLADAYAVKLCSQTVNADAGLGFVSVEGLSLLLTPGKHYAMGLSWSGTATAYKAPTAATVSFGTSVGRAQSTHFPSETPLTQVSPIVTTTGMYNMRVITASMSAYAPSGEVLTPAITPASCFAWRTLNYTADVPTGTAVTVDVLPASGTTPVPGWSGLAPGADLSLLTIMPVRLRARLSTSNTAVTPALLDWGLCWQAETDRRVESAWSVPVVSTQDSQAPFVVSVTPDGPNPSRTPTVHFLVQFSEAVEGVGSAAPFGDFTIRPGSVPGASIVAARQTEDPGRYDVEVDTGHADGSVAIDVLAGGDVHDLARNPLSAGYAAGESCTLDYTPPVVAEIIRLDESPTNAPVVHFGVRFSEPVTGVPLAAPFAGFSASGLPDAAVVAISGNGAAYAVSVKTGPSDGVLQLAIDSDAAARDAAGWPLAGGQVSAETYQVSHLRVTSAPASLLTVNRDDPFRLSVTASGGMGERKFQWFYDDTAKALSALYGETASILDIPHARLADCGVYYCEVSDAHETIPSPSIRVQVQDGGTAPYVAWVTPSGPNPARTPSVRFIVQFSTTVTGVGLAAPFSDFALRPGSVPDASIVAVRQTEDPSRYEVEVDTGSAGGTVAIDVITGGNIHDLSGNPLSSGNSTGEAFTLDYTPPTVSGIARLDASPTNAPVVRFGVTFSEPVTGVPLGAPFTGFSAGGLSDTNVVAISGSGAVYTVSVQTGASDGALWLAVDAVETVQDAVGWPLATGQVSVPGYQMSHLRFTAVPAPLMTVNWGDPCSMSVEVTGGMGARRFQWYFDDSAKPWSELSGETNPTLDIWHVCPEDDGVYYCEVTDAHETIQSSPSTRLQVRAVLAVAGVRGLFMAAAALAVAGAWGARARRSGGDCTCFIGDRYNPLRQSCPDVMS